VGTKPSAVPKSDQSEIPLATVSAVRGPRSKLMGMPLISIAAAAFAVEIPFFFFGMPSGHDFEFHLYSWLEVLSQWKQGIIYPRWAALAHFAYGEPRFVFYPPASWTLGAALSAIFPWTLVSGIYIWLVLAGAGVSMFLLARRWLDRRDATFAAVLYAVNPYHLVIVYWRSAFAELLASMLLPLLLLLVLRAGQERRRFIIPMALVLAGSWLTNAPSAVMIHYSFALLIVVIAWQRRSVRLLLPAFASVLLGAALAAFYLGPAIYEQKWVDIAQSVSFGLRPVDSFLFSHTTDPDHNAFNRLVSSVASAEILLTFLVTWAARSWLRRNRELWVALAAWAAVCTLLMLPVTNFLWTVLPKLRFMQFPWRFLLCLGVPFSLFTAMAIKKWPARIALYLAMLCVIGWAGHHFQPPWWDEADDLREMQDNMGSGAGYEGTEEYTPIGAAPLSIDKDARRVTVEGAAHAAIRVFEWGTEHREFGADMSAADNLVLHLFHYPAWRVEVNGRAVEAAAHEGTGQMLIPVQAGMNRVQIVFVRTRDRLAGGWISIAAIVFILFWLVGPTKVRRAA
jgi:6-pyruvoyl-tetrahydropterin synthase related domain